RQALAVLVDVGLAVGIVLGQPFEGFEEDEALVGDVPQRMADPEGALRIGDEKEAPCGGCRPALWFTGDADQPVGVLVVAVALLLAGVVVGGQPVGRGEDEEAT